MRLRLETLIACSLVVLALLLRPMIMGQVFTFAASIVFLLLGLLTFLATNLDQTRLREISLPVGGAIMLWIGLMLQAVANGVTQPYPIFALINISSTVIGAGLCFSNRAIHDAFFKIFIAFFMFEGASFCVTALLSNLFGIQGLLLANVDVFKYEGFGGTIWFPATLGYGVKQYGALVIPRLAAGFRESGIAQAFIAASIGMFPATWTKRKWGWLGLALLIFAGLATQSTIGIAVVCLAALYRVLMEPGAGYLTKSVLACLALALACYGVSLSLYDESIGLASKIETDSYWDRRLQMEHGIELFFQNPMGAGVYAEGAAGINLIASLGGLGLIGLALLSIQMLSASTTLGRVHEKWAVVLPIFVTALSSQPLLDAPLVYVFYLFLGFDRNSAETSALPYQQAATSQASGVYW